MIVNILLRGTSIDNLKYLTSGQAIEDIAEFIRQKNKEKNLDQKWIVVGGGYAGSYLPSLSPFTLNLSIR